MLALKYCFYNLYFFHEQLVYETWKQSSCKIKKTEREAIRCNECTACCYKCTRQNQFFIVLCNKDNFTFTFGLNRPSRGFKNKNIKIKRHSFCSCSEDIMTCILQVFQGQVTKPTLFKDHYTGTFSFSGISQMVAPADGSAC